MTNTMVIPENRYTGHGPIRSSSDAVEGLALRKAVVGIGDAIEDESDYRPCERDQHREAVAAPCRSHSPAPREIDRGPDDKQVNRPEGKKLVTGEVWPGQSR